MPLAFNLAEQLMEEGKAQAPENSVPVSNDHPPADRKLQSSSGNCHTGQLQYHGLKARASIPGMQGGDGEGSYTRSSRGQAGLIPRLQRILGEAISELNLPIESTYRVADFGCAVGANTLSFANFIAESLKKRCTSQSTQVPEVQCFFADLPTNDFNTLFQQFPVQHLDGDHAAKIDEGSHEVKDGSRSYFAAGVPGSFYDRMFPCASLQIAMSTYSLQWLSKVPSTVQDASLPTYNRGRVWIDGASHEVAEEYAKASRRDLGNFFRHRAQELVPGGLLFLQVMARGKRECPEEQFGPVIRRVAPTSPSFEAAWDELIAQGVIESKVRDSFNIPLCFPSLEEMKEAIEATSAFQIKQLEFWEDGESIPIFEDPQVFAQFIMNLTKSMLNPILEPYLAPESVAKLFEVTRQKLAAEWAVLRPTLTKFPGISFCVVVLVKK